ncbi:MAG: ABC transporter substrate-binding protein [Helicobacteraceae bacterium]|jgi:signal transduction histidine kinase/ABC-type nitrate/sulfonate/bicarbonate transport system substrate-binding protein|nr:ABC transporter substrate-binding protein [Helicobacteraceae bacterium]
MKKIMLLLLLSSISLFAVQKVVLQLNWLHQYQFAGYYVAKEMGFYKDAGIDVEIKEFNRSTDLSTVIEKGKADFAIGRSSLIIDKINGKDVVALGTIFQQSPLILLTRDDTGIQTISDLRNRRIMMTKDAKESAAIMAMLFSNGLNENDIEIVPHSFNIDDLINKNVDAMASYISNEPIQMAEKGVAYKVFYPKDSGFHFYSDILFTSSEFIEKNPNLTQKFYEATINGWEYAFENISETAEIIYKHYNSQNKNLIQLIKEGEVLKRLAYHKNGTIGYLDCNQLKDIVKVYKVLGLVTKDIDMESFIYEYNHPKEVAFTLSYDDIFHSALVSVLVLVTLGSSLLFVSLRKRWLLTKHGLKEEIDRQKMEIDKQNRVIMEQSKIAAVGEMLSNIAHQWRQPLNIISLNIVKIETGILLGREIKKEELLQISDDINRQAQYLSQTIDDFRNIFNANIDSIEPFDLNDAIKKLNELTKDAFANNQIEIVVMIEPCRITYNESLLIQSLLNIYNNALDAIIENQSVHKYFFIETTCNADGVVIMLKDSGGGIDDEILLKIFEPYYTTKHKSKGTGLGLYITYRIITEHFNGEVSVHNADYEYSGLKLRGAEFVITIPKA